ncbi:MAG: (4Fe-4S)-binding protein [Candidatus Altiarchaeales archaeon]|nr:(4Fe-4S)-binding protein [Candidatus Altiarchaeales archaeon]MBD3415767.1 (4Fe-4S)-binding protein [Candidatus Altiarchaeales archaeon]
MKQVTVLSGKGGTGKTSLVGAFASLEAEKVMADCDVDASNLHLLLDPEVREEHDFKAFQTAEIDPSRCRNCGLCTSKCRFDAIKDCEVDALHCEGCGVCKLVCPHNAVRMVDKSSGKAFVSSTRHGMLSHARLKPGEEASGKLVTVVRENARRVAEEHGVGLIILDGSPGIGCPVIASIGGADLALVVAEPTVSGVHDMKRVLDVTDHFKVKALVCVNKSDINPGKTTEIREYCGDRGVGFAGMVPYSRSFTEAMIERKTIVEYGDGELVKSVERIWDEVKRNLGG